MTLLGHGCVCARTKFVLLRWRVQIMQGERGVVAHVKLPHDEELRKYDRLELDFTLGCPGAAQSPSPLDSKNVKLKAKCREPRHVSEFLLSIEASSNVAEGTAAPISACTLAGHAGLTYSV